MSEVVDLDVTAIAERLYELQRLVEAEPHADAVSRSDWVAVLLAVIDLEELVRDRLG
jgi:hypothetical protein